MSAQETVVLVLGASGPVGQALLPPLIAGGGRVLAVSRTPPADSRPGVMWFQQDLEEGPLDCQAAVLISSGPLKLALAQARAMTGLGRIIALSSASLYFKKDSGDDVERDFMAELEETEARLEAHCRERRIPLTLFRPAMIYGGRDGNVDRLASLLERLPVVPVAGRGRRHPVHAQDLAQVMVRAIRRQVTGRFALGGGETLDYPTMLERIAKARGHGCRVVSVPRWGLLSLLAMAHGLGRLKDVRPEMVRRQALDLLVDDQAARDQLGWAPRRFEPPETD